MTIRARTPEEIEAEEKGFTILLFLAIGVFFLLLHLTNVTDKQQPDYQLRQYQKEIHKIETEDKIKADTEAARLKLIQLHEQRLKELDKWN